MYSFMILCEAFVSTQLLFFFFFICCNEFESNQNSTQRQAGPVFSRRHYAPILISVWIELA